MKGRLENSIKIETKITEILKVMPPIISEYYSQFKQGRQPRACYTYIVRLQDFLKSINENIMEITISDLNNVSAVSNFMTKISTTEKDGEIKETSISYQQLNWAILNSFYSFLCDNDYIEKNPMDKIKRVKGKDAVQHKFLTERDLKKILYSVELGVETKTDWEAFQIKWKSRDKSILMLFMETGMRCTALSEINIEDVNLDERTISVVNKGHKAYVYKIDNALVEVLREWLATRSEILGDTELDALFISTHKERLNSASISYLVKKYSKDALGYSVSPHKLRAAFANIILRKSNGNIYLAQRLLDHSSPDTTKIYLNDITEEDKDRATQMISESIFQED